MALRSAWWMQPRVQAPATNPTPSHQTSSQTRSHLNWPWNSITSGISFAVLEKTVKENRGAACRVDKYSYVSQGSRGGEHSKWQFEKSVTLTTELIDSLKQTNPDTVKSVFYFASGLCGEAIQALGFHLELPPRFFNFPYVRSSTGNTVEQYSFFSLQFFDQYEHAYVPAEARRSGTSPSCTFRGLKGHNKHTWHVTRIALIFLKSPDGKKYRGLVHLDPLDVSIWDGLSILMTRDEEIPPGDAEEYAGLGQILSEVIYIITFNWSALLTEAATHLQVLSQKCVEENLSSTEQLSYTRELHQLSPLWVELGRRLVATKDTVTHLIEHPFFKSINGFNGRVAIEEYLNKQVKVLDDHLTRCKELAEQTNVLISLIFNIATLQDTRAAVEESKAANNLSASIRRVTLLTFFYLPLTLSASLFGMNVKQITGEETHAQFWAYLLTAICLTLATFVGWFFWSRVLSRLEELKRKRIARVLIPSLPNSLP